MCRECGIKDSRKKKVQPRKQTLRILHYYVLCIDTTLYTHTHAMHSTYPTHLYNYLYILCRLQAISRPELTTPAAAVQRHEPTVGSGRFSPTVTVYSIQQDTNHPRSLLLTEYTDRQRHALLLSSPCQRPVEGGLSRCRIHRGF